jgi:very-short-patch-repair endonuclease
MLKILRDNKFTREAEQLKIALENFGLTVNEEFSDGFKTVDLRIPEANIDVEVDGLHHLTNAQQINRDLNRGYYSFLDGIATIHIPNKLINEHKQEIAKALAEACRIRQERLNLRIH